MKSTLSSSLKSQKVLVADADVSTRAALCAAITQWGYEVIEATSGKEAWEILKKSHSPRLLILNWLMPNLDGLALCTRIQQELLPSPYPYIILLTEAAGTTDIIKGLEAGADEFLSKPVNMSELRSRLAAGERIIKYEYALAAKNRQVQSFILEMEMLSNYLINITTNITDIIKTGNTLEKTDKNANHLQKIYELNENVTQLKEIIHKFQSKIGKETS